MYKCAMCGRPLPPEKEKALLEPDWRGVKCACGSGIFAKGRSQHVKRVRAI